MLQLLVNGFLTLIFLLHFLSPKKICNTVVLMIIKQKVLIVTNGY